MRRASFLVAAAVVTPLSSMLGELPGHAQGLQPPPPLTPGASPPPTLAAPTPYAGDESKDSGLGLEWVWINADVGLNSTSMNSLSSSNLGSIQKTSSFGGVFGAGAGIRLFFFTAGVRVRDLQLSNFNLWEVDGEAAFHVRIDHVDPYFGARGGYAFVGTLSSDAVQTAPGGSASDVSVHGVNLGLIFGVDVYLTHVISLGIEGNPEFLFLQRPPVALPPGVDPKLIPLLPPQEQTLYQESGSSIGFGFTGTAHLGLHF